MKSFINRNLRLFFSQPKNVILSLFSSMISLTLYLVFLKNNLLDSMSGIDNADKILDLWLIGGILTITAMTTSFTGISQSVYDREKGVLKDLSLTSLKSSEVSLSYLCSSVIISFVMQATVYLLTFALFFILDDLKIDVETSLILLPIFILNSLVWSGFNLLVIKNIKNIKSLGRIEALLSTAIGFFAGAYIPLGVFSKSAYSIIKLTPAPYSSSLFREILLKSPLEKIKMPNSEQFDFKKLLGIGIEFYGKLTSEYQNALILIFFCLICLIGGMIIDKIRK